MIKNKDPRIKQIRESFCRLKAQLLLNFMILKIPMGSALLRPPFFGFVGLFRRNAYIRRNILSPLRLWGICSRPVF